MSLKSWAQQQDDPVRVPHQVDVRNLQAFKEAQCLLRHDWLFPSVQSAKSSRSQPCKQKQIPAASVQQ